MKKELRQQVYNKFKGRCAYCGKKIKYKDMQVDHVKPKARGGTDDLDNLLPACRSCNHYKRDMNLEVFRNYISTLHERVEKIYIVRVAIDYGVVKMRDFQESFILKK